ncbi:MAG TPA: helix-turn-helix domain-containing protein [Caulobacteraceae bacterium]
MKKSDFDGIVEGLNDAIAIVEGRAEPGSFRVHVPDDVDVKSIRQAMGLTQNAFAAKYGFPAATVRDWEQHRRRPEASARVLLRVIERRPDAVEDALSAP